MSTEENKKAVRRMIEESWNEGKLETMDELCAPSYGADGFKQTIAGLRRGFPDIHIIIDDMVAEGDKVAYSWHWTGTHTGEYRGVAPTGKTVNVAGMVIYQFADGKLVNDHGVSSPDIRQYLLGS